METAITPLLYGTWILESMGFEDTNQTFKELYGKNPLGIVMFDTSGYMNAQMGASDRLFFESEAPGGGSMLENSNAFSTYMAFFGTFHEATPGLLRIQLRGSLFPNWVGKEMIRYASVTDAKLYLTTPPTKLGDSEIVIKARWYRVS